MTSNSWYGWKASRSIPCPFSSSSSCATSRALHCPSYALWGPSAWLRGFSWGSEQGPLLSSLSGQQLAERDGLHGHTQKAQRPQQLMPSGEPSQLAQLLSRRAVSGFTDMASICGMGARKVFSLVSAYAPSAAKRQL